MARRRTVSDSFATSGGAYVRAAVLHVRGCDLIVHVTALLSLLDGWQISPAAGAIGSDALVGIPAASVRAGPFSSGAVVALQRGRTAAGHPGHHGYAVDTACVVGRDAQRSVSAALPGTVSSFVGPRRELAEIAAALQGARPATLVGTGGCGKTRLAVEAARSELFEPRSGATRVPRSTWWRRRTGSRSGPGSRRSPSRRPCCAGPPG